MHICFICHEYPPAKHGGVGSFTQTMARELVRHGHAVTVVGLYPQTATVEETDGEVRVIRLPLGRIPFLKILANYLRLKACLVALHQKQPIDVIEGAERSFLLVPRGLPVPKIIRMHGGYAYFRRTLGEPLRRQLVLEERRSFQVATHICAVSRFVAETTRGYLNLGSIPIPVILNPVDLRVFRPNPATVESSGLIVYVGTVIEKKGVRQLVQAMPEIVAACPEARLVIYGNDTPMLGTGTSLTADLRQSIPAHLEEKIVFAGPVSRDSVPDVLAQASVCVFPSHMEALPIAWVEGLAMGKAVLGSETGPGPEVIEDGVSGLLCNPHDPHSIATAIVRLLRDPELRLRLGRQARRRAEELFSLETLIHQNIAYYQECAATWPGRSR